VFSCAGMIISYDSDKCGSELCYQLLAPDEILGLKLRAPRPDSKQRLGQKREHRLLHLRYAYPRVIPNTVFGRHSGRRTQNVALVRDRARIGHTGPR
jgi:hypothetical protein